MDEQDGMIKNIGRLALTEDKHRKFLVKYCRVLDGFLHKKADYCRPHNSPGRNLIDDILEHSLFTEAYMKEDPQVSKEQHLYGRSMSMQEKENFVGGRKCAPPLVRINGQVIPDEHFYQKGEGKPLFVSHTVNVSVESEPNSIILYTTNDCHPLMSRNPNVVFNVATFTLSAPCTFIAVAKDMLDEEKLASETVVLQMIVNSNQSAVSGGNHQGAASMERPLNYYDLMESRESFLDDESVLDIDFNPQSSRSSRFRN